MKEKLIKIVGNLKSDDVKYVLNELGKGSSADDAVAQGEVVEFTQDDLSLIKLTLATLIENDDAFANKFQSIFEAYDPNRAIDPYTAGLIALGILALSNIANNLIKAVKPNKVTIKEEDKTIEIDRDYTNVSDAVKPLASVFGGAKDE